MLQSCVWMRSGLFRPSSREIVVVLVRDKQQFHGSVGVKGTIDPNQMRWMPVPIPKERTNFLQGLHTVGGSGDPASGGTGFAVHVYVANASMGDRAFVNGDGDFLIVPQQGTLRVTTEMGRMTVEPCEICVVPRGVRFKIDVDGPSRGYVCELFRRHFVLPELGPIGSNGLANPQDFLTPTAWYEDREDVTYRIVQKLGGELFQCTQRFSPFNVVAWRGNYAPCKYDCRKFNCMNSVTYDHPDPSIYTVLTCPSDEAGVAIVDFVIFPPRWMVMEHTFRPPWFHRNCMSEFMGMIWGQYDAKGGNDASNGTKQTGFVPGGASLHSPMVAHGPDAKATEKAAKVTLKPEFFDKGLAFMFETSKTMRLSRWALVGPHRDKAYHKCWSAIPRRFPTDEKELRRLVAAKAASDENADHLLAWRTTDA